MNSSENFGSSCMVAIIAVLAMPRNEALLYRGSCCDSQRMTIETPFANKVTGPEDAYDCPLAPLRNDGELDLAL